MSIACLSHGCVEQLNVLRKSPVFAMSRGGKELFHTNFLSFILELSADQVPQQDWPEIEALQHRLKTLLFGEGAPTKVLTWRERSSLDLIVMAAPTTADVQGSLPVSAAFAGAAGQEPLRWSDLRPVPPSVPNCVAVVIEAKLKALPTKDQLVRYNEKLIKALTLEMESPVIIGDRIWGRTSLQLLDQANAHGGARCFAYDVKSEEPSNSDQLEPSKDAEQVTTPTGTRRGTARFARLDASLHRILLSPANAHAVSAVVGNTGWTPLSFKDFIGVFPEQARGGGLMLQLLADYRSSTAALLHVIGAAADAADCFCRDDKHTLNSLYAATQRLEFVHLRIHDVVGKFAYDSLQRSLVKQLKKLLPDPLIDVTLDGHSIDFEFVPSTFMSHAQPGINFEFRAERKLPGAKKSRTVSVGVQMQGTTYRHFISVSHPVNLEGTGLTGLALLLGDPTQWNESSQRWWRAAIGDGSVLTGGNHGGFKPFGKEAFLYTDINIAHMNCGKLMHALSRSLTVVVTLIIESIDFKEAVVEFLRGG